MATLQELLEQRDELDRQIEAVKRAQSNPAAMFVPKRAIGKNYFVIHCCEIGTYAVGEHWTRSSYKVKPVFRTREHAPVFRTREHAEAIAFARSIEDQMRVQPGCVVAEDSVWQWVVTFSHLEPFAICINDLHPKMANSQFGVFDTEENLQAAIKAVGAENLIRAAKARVGIY